jgi:hypothetical protein
MRRLRRRWLRGPGTNRHPEDIDPQISKTSLLEGKPGLPIDTEERGSDMSYRNKTYVAFASEDMHCYRLMKAWRENDNIEFDFFDAHDLYISRDSSKDETIKKNLTERMKNAKQFVLLGSPTARSKGGDGKSFLAHEVENMIKLKLPIVIANIDGSRDVEYANIPQPLTSADYYSESVSFQPKIIKYALDYYAPNFSGSDKTGAHHYKAKVYSDLGL